MEKQDLAPSLHTGFSSVFPTLHTFEREFCRHSVQKAQLLQEGVRGQGDGKQMRRKEGLRNEARLRDRVASRAVQKPRLGCVEQQQVHSSF